LVTVSLWSNDANEFIQGCHVDPICIGDNAPRVIGEFAGRLSSILNVLREAAPDTQVVVVGAVDVNVGAFAFSHPLIQAINAAMADVADRAGARFADPFPVFNPAGDTGAALCPLTGVCSPVRDTHPSDLGYQVLADLIADQLRPGAL
jgi:lysophospholipase L1-like esterase